MKKYKNSYSFYIVNDLEEEWYWNGKKFTDNVGQCMIYYTNLERDFILNNYLESPIAKEIFKNYDNLRENKRRLFIKIQ